MSDYWDAIARAALDIPSDATPRPRSTFEPESITAGAFESGLIELDEDVVPTSRTKVSPRAPLPDGALYAATADAPVAGVDDRRETTVTRDDPQTSPPAATRPTDQPGSGLEIPDEALPSVFAAAQPSPTVIERIERTETQHLVTTVEPPPALPAPDGMFATQPGAAAERTVETVHEGSGFPDSWPANKAAIDTTEERRPSVTAAKPVDEPVPPERVLGPAQSQPLIIEIERVDIHIENDRAVAAVPAPLPRADTPEVPSLSEYLARRSGTPA